ncbi:MAG: hypothetical protein PHC28_13730 [Flavobacterium sp.]|uniref:hypothetical protein n=1 Tax=Flavobacterium sp. TaxID=239 RepID=UPI0026084728|nr:hypothetical protein [Flavobacterium sp.]MDD5151513.1 hypothetical protein [Flavobacterium sp.]
MAYYSYKRVRELIPNHIEEKYKNYSDDPDTWFWDNSYDGDLFDACADYIEELQSEINKIKKINGSKIDISGWVDYHTLPLTQDQICIFKCKDYTTEILGRFNKKESYFYIERGDGTIYKYSFGIEWVIPI